MTQGPYTLHGPDGDLGRRADLHDALAYARAVCSRRQIWVDVRDERGLSLGVACPRAASASTVMAQARKRNFNLQTGNQEELNTRRGPQGCGSHGSHDWIHSERAPTRLYRCRMCDVVGYQHAGKVRVHACAKCGVGAVTAVEGKHRRMRWLCKEHGPNAD